MKDQSFNLDTWRINRAKAHRQDEEIIDHLCAALLQAQQELVILKAKFNEEKAPT
jgi:hypothetical protein